MQVKISHIALIVLGTVAVVVGYTKYTQVVPCAAPIAYTIGTLDPRFGVTRAAFIADVNQASALWGSAIGRPLFVYDPAASLTINLVYDTRQQTTQQELQIKNSISQSKDTAALAKQAYLSVQVKYQEARAQYLRAIESFTQAQDAYNTRVDFLNSRGGATKAEFVALQATKAELLNRQETLDAQREEVNSLAEQTNASIQKYNALVDDINLQVHTINTDGLTGTQFEEGVYVVDESGKYIDIYQFDDQVTFIRVLAHELGHALGLAHVSLRESIMNPINEGKSLQLSPADLQELGRACAVSNQQ